MSTPYRVTHNDYYQSALITTLAQDIVGELVVFTYVRVCVCVDHQIKSIDLNSQTVKITGFDFSHLFSGHVCSVWFKSKMI